MTLREILDEIADVRIRIMASEPGSIERNDLIIALIVLQDMAIKAAMIPKAA